MGNPNVATGTPVVSTHDNRGLAVRALNWNHDSSDNPLRLLVTQTQTDDASRVVSHRDPRLFAAWSADSSAPANLCTTPSLAGQMLRRESTDSGEQVTLFDAAGRAVWTRDGCGTVQTVAYDEPGRPSSGSEQLSGSSEIRVSWRSEYGDSGPADDGSQGNNLRGVCVAQYDSGGLSEVNSVALSGVVLSQGQRFLASAEALPDWPEDETGREALLEAETYATSVTADARGTVLKQTDAKGHVQAWRYNVSGAACYQTVTPAGGETQTLLSNVTWSAAGQVLTESAGNGVTTQYSYDPQNQWLATITAQRADKTMLQALSYGYDFTGNITSLSDGSVASRYYRNQATGGTRLFTYDALYQLLSATGRENANHSGMQYSGLPVLSDDSQYVNYTRSYQYDDSGNLQTLKHSGAANFTRTMTTESTSSRSVQQNDGGPQTPDAVAGWFDANGNLLTLQARAPVTDDSGLDPLVWDGSNNLQSVTVLSRSSGDNDREIYQYSGSQRVRKQTRTLANSGSGLWSVDEVRYLPGLELRKSWQETAGSSAAPSLTEELHVITGQAGRAGIRVLHWETGRPQEIAANDQVRWSVDDNIGSLALELDAEGQLISREEYYPFGGTAVWAGRNEVEASYKTVRYSGKERDSTGLYYYGHRYYAPWLCRWVSADPAGEVDGLNLFRMVRNNPVTWWDASGLEITVVDEKGLKNNKQYRDQVINEFLSANEANRTLAEKIISEYHTANAAFESKEHFIDIVSYDVSMAVAVEKNDPDALAQERYMTYEGIKNTFIKKTVKKEEYANIRTGKFMKGYKLSKKKPAPSDIDKLVEANEKSGEGVVRVYRTMPIQEARELLKGGNDGEKYNFNALMNHLGDYAEAMNYYHKNPKNQVMLEFVLKKGAAGVLFSPAASAIPEVGEVPALMAAIAQQNKQEAYAMASKNEGLLDGYVGIKSEQHGKSKFSLAVGNKKKSKQLFGKLTHEVNIIKGRDHI